VIFTILLYVSVAVTLAYLIYRYGRYSEWNSTAAGQAYMAMMICLMALVIYSLLGVAFPDPDWRAVARPIVVGAILAALVRQVVVVVHEQGGWRRTRRVREPAEID